MIRNAERRLPGVGTAAEGALNLWILPKLEVHHAHHVIEIFGINFPAALKPLVLAVGIDDPDPSPRTNTFFSGLSIEQGTRILGSLKEAVKQVENGLLVLGTR